MGAEVAELDAPHGLRREDREAGVAIAQTSRRLTIDAVASGDVGGELASNGAATTAGITSGVGRAGRIREARIARCDRIGPTCNAALCQNRNMKHLKSSLRDLHGLFDRAVTARHLAEPLVSFDAPRQASDVRSLLDRWDFDVAGVRVDGETTGFAERVTLGDGQLGDYIRRFGDSGMAPLDENDSVGAVLAALRGQPYVFVRMMGQVFGIVTKGDLQKAPVRMWFFAVLSLLEMHLLRLIREHHPNDSWRALLTTDRLEGVDKLYAERQRRNEAIDGADCLQFADKRDICLKSDALIDRLGITSKRQFTRDFKDFEALRNDLAHAQDIVKNRWPALALLSETAEQYLTACELH